MNEHDEQVWTRGFACALAIVHRIGTDKAMAADALHESGLDLDDLRKAGVEKFDLGAIEGSAREPLTRYGR